MTFSDRMNIFRNHSGISLVEILASVAILSMTLVLSINLSDTKNKVLNKSESSLGVRGIEDGVVAAVEMVGLEIISKKKCSSASSVLNNLLGSGLGNLKLVDLTSKETASLPGYMAKRCRRSQSSSQTGFVFCKKVKPIKTSDFPFLQRNTVVIEGAYFYKNDPQLGKYANCSSIDMDNPNHMPGGDFYYNIAIGKNQDIGKGIKMGAKRRYRYLRADNKLLTGLTGK